MDNKPRSKIALIDIYTPFIGLLYEQKNETDESKARKVQDLDGNTYSNLAE